MSPAPPSPLDLRGTPCPLNWVRTQLTLETLPPGAELRVWLDRGEPEQLVSQGLRDQGHAVETTELDSQAVCLTVRVAAGG